MRKSTNQRLRTFLLHPIVEISLGAFATGFVSYSLAKFLPSFISKSGPNAVQTGQGFAYLAFGIFMLQLTIGGVAIMIKHKNREVILLKQRLAEIYLSALKKSALNPQLDSSISHD
jgi:hypothetical protein